MCLTSDIQDDKLWLLFVSPVDSGILVMFVVIVMRLWYKKYPNHPIHKCLNSVSLSFTQRGFGQPCGPNTRPTPSSAFYATTPPPPNQPMLSKLKVLNAREQSSRNKTCQ